MTLARNHYHSYTPKLPWAFMTETKQYKIPEDPLNDLTIPKGHENKPLAAKRLNPNRRIGIPRLWQSDRAESLQTLHFKDTSGDTLRKDHNSKKSKTTETEPEAPET